MIDMDEFLCVTEKELIEEYKLGTTILKVQGMQMIGESNKKDLSDIDLNTIIKCVEHEPESKKLCFLREKITDINYSLGAHTCNFVSKIVKYSSKIYINKHMCFLGLPFLINKYKMLFERTKNEREKFNISHHYTDDEEKITNEYNSLLEKTTLLEL